MDNETTAHYAVSVIIPAYNAQDTLRATVNSLLEQTLKDIEIIIVDDGSVDDTAKIILELKKEHKNIVPVFSKNGGVCAARNLGLDVCTGEFVAFMDADDAADSTMYEKMYTAAKKWKMDFVQCGRKEIYPDGHEKNVVPNWKLFKSNANNPLKIFGSSIFIWDKLFSNKLIQDNHLRFDTNVAYGEESSYILRYLMLCKRVCSVNETLYFYAARREGAATLSFDRRLLDNARGVLKACEAAVNGGCFEEVRPQLWNFGNGCFHRRVNDFVLYNDKELQKGIVDGFFDVFDKYFMDWRKSLVPKSFFKRNFTSDWKKFIDKKAMYRYIDRPNWSKKLSLGVKNLGKKIIFPFTKGFSNKVKKKREEIKARFKSHQNAFIFSKYLKAKVDPNIALLSANSALNFVGNIFYLAKALSELEPKLKIYIVSNDFKRDFTYKLGCNFNCEFVTSQSPEHIKLLATAKYLATNTKMPTFFIKKPEQVYINTWHGVPLKTLGKSMLHGKKDMALNQKEFFTADYLLYPNEFTMEKMMADFELDKLYSGKALLAAYPRNSVLFDENGRDAMRKAMGVSDKRVYVYMPTWRGGSTNDINAKEYGEFVQKLLKEWDKKLAGNVVIFVKLHSYVMNKVKLDDLKKIRIFDCRMETYNFLRLADGLITDYSSVFFDFAVTKREILLFTYDREEYMSERGVYMELDSLPFPQFSGSDELIRHINSQSGFEPSEEYLQFLDKFCPYDSPDCAKAVAGVLLGRKLNASDGRIVEFSDRKSREYDCIFMPSLDNDKNRRLFEKLSRNANESQAFVFLNKDVTPQTDSILNSCVGSRFSYIIVPGEMVFSKSEAIRLYIYRKLHIFKGTARKIYRRELNRVLPGIKFSSFTNYSDTEKFADITRLFGNKKSRRHS